MMYNLFKRGNLIPYLLYSSYIIYLITYFGLLYINPYYINILEIITHTYIAITLMYYFNIFSDSQEELSNNMRRIIFSSGLILFTNLFGNIIQLKNTFN
jgi:hypothetical protein